jgi:hypothetical protein
MSRWQCIEAAPADIQCPGRLVNGIDPDDFIIE